MKTLDNIENEVAQENGFSSMDSAFWCLDSGGLYELMKEICIHYAAYMCEEQRKLCTENARLHFHDGFNKTGEQLKYFQSGADYLRVDKDSILNAPLATDKNK